MNCFCNLASLVNLGTGDGSYSPENVQVTSYILLGLLFCNYLGLFLYLYQSIENVQLFVTSSLFSQFILFVTESKTQLQDLFSMLFLECVA